LIWIDHPDNDNETRDRLVAAHPKLHIRYIVKYQDAETYLRSNAAEIRSDKKLIVISRGYYADEDTCFLDVVDLLDQLKFPVKVFAVYTKHRKDLLKRYSRARDHIIVEKRTEIIAFINDQFTD
jgi:predicted MPP superfamily phosphohydrolase